MKSTIRHGVLPALLALWATDAAAAPFQITFTSEVDGIGGDLDGLVSVGDLFTVHVVVDNGGTSALSQTWTYAHLISAAVEAGGYSALITSGFYVPPATLEPDTINAPVFVTDADGTITRATFFGAVGSGSDSFGGTVVALYNGHVDTSRQINEGIDSNFRYRPHFGGFPNGRPQRWSDPIPAPSVIPLPASLPLMLAGLAALGGLAVARRRAA